MKGPPPTIGYKLIANDIAPSPSRDKAIWHKYRGRDGVGVILKKNS